MVGAALAMLAVGLCSGGLWWSAAEAADGTADEPVQARDVIISATKTPLPVSQVTSAVEVISGEELEQKKIKTVIDALRLAQGVAAFSNGGPGTNATVRIRGANAAHTLVLIDGTIVNSPTSGDFNFANLTAENIERIEILRGAQSMLYGSDAIGGVINIITKRGTGKPAASTFFEYGSFASIREGAQASGAKGPIDFAMSLSRWDTASFSAVNYKRGAFERDAFRNWQASGRLGVALPKEGRLDLGLRWWNSDVNLDSAFGNFKFDVFGSKQTTRTLILSAIYDQPLTSWWSQKLTLAQANERILFDGGASRLNLDTGITTGISFRTLSDIEILNRRLEWQHNFQIGKPLLITAGYQFREESGENASIGPSAKILSTHGGYAQSQLNIQDRLLVTAGIRQDSYNVFGDATTYRVTGGYLIPETGTKFRASYATGFRAPTINQLFFPGFGNPNLKPEESRSFDAGVDQFLLKDRLKLSAGYFWNRFQNLIVNVPVGALLAPQNVGEAKSQGWEAGFQFALTKGLDLRGQYTYTLTRDLSTDRRLPRWPVHQASLGVSYRPIDPVAINVDYRYVGARFNDTANTQKMGSFGVVNLAATYDVSRNWQVFGRIENLFNQDYEEVLFFGTPIRSIYGGIKVSL
ncbi:TonB-dependent receptor plug domain-containing protein [Candidatus Nitrospira bockiana]